jgi:hypothetical protein
MELERDKKTATVEAVKDGKVIGQVVTMGDDLIEDSRADEERLPKEITEKFGG